MKQCSKCDRELPLEAFTKYRRNKDGLQTFCRECASTKARAWYEREENRQRALAAQKLYSERTGGEAARRSYLRHKYGMEPEEYEKRVAEQDGKCLLCGKEPHGHYKRLFIDHNHRTGEVRALLCHSCNAALGGFREDPEILIRAYTYLVDGPDILRGML